LLAPMEHIGRWHLGRAVSDPELREKLTPRYSIGCKRVLISNDYYPALAQPNVEVVTEGIDRVEADGIRTRDGVLHEFDTLILGTGFHVTDNPGFARIRGRDGVTLEKAWADGGMRAHLGAAVPGFPNLFLLLGPNTGIGHTSAVYMIESQIAFVLQALEHTRRHDVAELEVRPEVEAAYNAEVARRSDRTVWKSGCESWYLDAAGRNTVLWPDLTFRFRQLTRRFRPGDFLLVPHHALSSSGDRRTGDRVLGGTHS
jgi:cation diffusion facilitator CzcD-associated flavoprotein CzcO